jgi:hypothetical protein
LTFEGSGHAAASRVIAGRVEIKLLTSLLSARLSQDMIENAERGSIICQCITHALCEVREIYFIASRDAFTKVINLI